MKFVIVSPRQTNGGPIALHALCKWLQELGYDAKIFYIGPFDYRVKYFWLKWLYFCLKDFVKLFLNFVGTENWKNKQAYLNGFVHESVKGCRRKWLPFVDDNTVVVYPEIVYGNFLHAKNVVRWFLYFNRYPNDNVWYGEKDMFCAYGDICRDFSITSEWDIFFISYFDLDFYKQYNFGERYGTCYIIRKGQDRCDLPKKFNGPIIDKLPEKDKVRIFNECEYCVSYDMYTAYSQIAAMCGCISLKIPELGKTKNDYLDDYPNYYGIAFSFDEIELEYARKTRGLVVDYYREINLRSKKETELFVEKCKSHFGGFK